MAASASISQILSSLHISPREISGKYGLIRIRTVALHRSRSLLSEIRTSPDPIDFSGRCLGYARRNAILRRRGVGKGEELVAPSAADADADWLGFLTRSFVIFCCLVGWKMQEKKRKKN